MKYLRQLRCKCHSAHKLPEVAPPKIEKRDFACLISNFRNVSLHTNPLQSFIVKYNKNETCGNLLLNKNLKGKACRSYDGEVIPFLKLPPQNSCVTSKAKGPFLGHRGDVSTLFSQALFNKFYCAFMLSLFTNRDHSE